MRVTVWLLIKLESSQFSLHNQLCRSRTLQAAESIPQRKLLLIFPVAYAEIGEVEEQSKCYRRRRASTNQVSVHERHWDSCGYRRQNDGSYRRRALNNVQHKIRAQESILHR